MTMVILWWLCDDFLFQAEDGIRDLVRSRGLGDVYKRQDEDSLKKMIRRMKDGVHVATPVFDGAKEKDVKDPVSYTHLTLPTSDLV